MAIKCDICGEEINHLTTFSFVVVGLIGGGMTLGMWFENQIFDSIGALFGLGLALKILYSFNPLHWKHIKLTGKLLNIISVK